LEIDARKIAHLARAAEVFIAESDLKYLECRFDALLLRKKGNYWEINHLEDAFRPEPPP
jgi:Holliday junction resolvase-like predicted endonuclease